MIDSNLKYKTGARRFWASVIDILIFIPLIFLDEFINFTDPFSILAWQASISLAGYSYSIIMHYKYGQTLGKMAFNIKVLDVSESQNLTFKQALLRDSVPILIDLMGFIYFSFLINKKPLSTNDLITNYEDLVAIVGLVWVLLELITMLANKKRRAIHDYIAKTVVIRIEARE